MRRPFIFSILVAIAISVFWIGCQDDLARITKVVNEGAVVEQTRATALSNIIDLSRNEHPDYGVCFSESDYPTVDDDKISLGFIESRKEFEVTLRRLRYNTEYNFRPYVYDEQDVIYGDVQSVTINSSEGIIAYHNSITTIDFTTAEVNSSISGLGSLKCIDFGLCYAIDATPTIESNTASLGELLNDSTFNTTLTGLDTWANYHVRAYGMLDSATIVYSDEWTFNLSEPQLTTGTVSIGTSQSVTVNGSIDGLGVQSVTDHGYCWSQNLNPTTLDQTVSFGPATSTGPIGKYISSVAIQTIYYVRAYAVSGGQTYYGDNVAFTIYAPDQINTGTISTQSSTAALAEGNIANNNIPLIQKGHCWSTNPNPTIADFRTQLGPQNPNINGVLNSQMNNLTTNQTYYVRAYAQDSVTVFYGDVETVNAVYFSIEILPQLSASSDSILAQGTLIVDGNVNIIDYGHCWSYGSGLPDTSDFRYSLGPTNSGQPNFTGYATGIAANSSPNFRAYATDGTTIVYSDVLEYEPVQFSVTNGSIQAAFNDSAICTADLNLTGFTTITEYGHCWIEGNGTPTISDERYVIGPATTSESNYVGFASGLLLSTTYTFRAYATDGLSVAYSSPQTFTNTNSISWSSNGSDIEVDGTLNVQSTMTITGNVDVIEFGHCIGVNPNPTIANQRTYLGTTSNSVVAQSDFTSNPHTQTYIRSYAQTANQVVYGPEFSVGYQGNWNQRANMPTARRRSWSFGLNGRGYVGGGRDENGDLIPYTHVYFVSSDLWAIQQSGPPAGSFYPACSDGTNGFVVAGNQLWKFSVGAGWSVPGTFPGGVIDKTAFFHLNGKLYLGPDQLGRFWEYDVANNFWTQKADFPGGPQDYCVGFGIANYGYVGLGYENSWQFDMWQYNPTTDSWSPVTGTTQVRQGNNSLNNHGYVGGSGYSNDFRRYIPSLDSWINIPSIPAAFGRDDAFSFTVGNKLYVGGGLTSPNGSVQNDFWEYSLEE